MVNRLLTESIDQSMFQNYDNFSEKELGEERLAKLRKFMQAAAIDVYLVPHADEYQNEYPPQYAWRLAWLTGFTGSAGYAVITNDDAIVFSDGRYTLQLSEQLNLAVFTPVDMTVTSPANWLSDKMNDGENFSRIGFDANLITLAASRNFKKTLKSHNIEFIPTPNLIDKIWEDQPNSPLEPVSIQDIEYSGELARDKIKRIGEKVKSKKCDLCLVSDPASIAWLFNIRGGDTLHTPLTLAHAILKVEGDPKLFIDKRKLDRETEAYLTQLAQLLPPNQLDEHLGEDVRSKRILIDPSATSLALTDIIEEHDGKIVEGQNPVVLPRATKNETEIEGSRRAHLRDGVAVTKFLYWLDNQKPGSVTEIDASKSLEMFRQETGEEFQFPLLDISFDTISGAGPNGAIVHYRVTHESDAMIEENSLYLVDSGGQYRDGTTDITRTVLIGSPPDYAVEDFTLVLKGHIAIALAQFPQSTRGIDLDPLARIALWKNGRDYAHGTGHGVGSYLTVHEGPQSISKRGMAELKPGMIISNEPGYYREGKYGIRIENLVLVSEPKQSTDGNIATMGFETLSLAPIDLRLIDPTLLDDEERHWLNAYHGWVFRELSPHLDNKEIEWLKSATMPITLELPASSA